MFKVQEATAYWYCQLPTGMVEPEGLPHRLGRFGGKGFKVQEATAYWYCQLPTGMVEPGRLPLPIAIGVGVL